MISLTPKVWDYRLVPTQSGVSIPSTAKHLRPIWIPGDDRWWNFGGDWGDTQGTGSGQNEIYAYDVALDQGLGNGLGWSKIEPYCSAPMEARPSGLDQGTVVYDSLRKLVWILPGYMNGSGVATGLETHSLAVPLAAGGNETEIYSVEPLTDFANNNVTSAALIIVNDDLSFEWILFDGLDLTSSPNRFLNCQRGFGPTPRGAHAVGTFFARNGSGPCGPRTSLKAMLPWTAFTYDPVTTTWQVRSKIKQIAGGEFTANGFYDEVLDKIIRIRGSSTIEVHWFSLPDLTRTTFTFSGFGLSSSGIGNNDIAWDPVARIAYFICPGVIPDVMLMYRPDTNTMVKATGTGIPPRGSTELPDGTGGGINNCYPKWDSANKVILWPFVYNFFGGHEFPDPTNTVPTATCRLYIYHPTTNTWETDAMLPGGPPYQRGNSWLYNPKENCLMGMGRSDGQMWLYRYASTAPSFRPVGVSGAIR